MIFWDTSAVLPLIVQEKESKELARLFASDRRMIVWWGCAVEVVSALSRLEREGALPKNHKCHAILERLEASWNEVNPSDQIRHLARRLLRVHTLRAADAIQLAAAVVASRSQPKTLPFVSRDERLADAAVREGFSVV